ncbi:hypothetical protein Pedsa_3316 [Pseudopedobacter saltans DSM 12145]|uniref:DUF4199 domain-containing protein n=1 Tax=Pseudopedobacter saltans (strain ATCC 51119 / DSM 12145 / JCM 21818 / CCUG 39354 / LMG 10337 / NBRC 100064 / NCIMB 13643) TaxID=762903 RepID=F0SCK7_PSESL|nr:DUF4199 domain-containing protein [Pseudopedobacter saltans]ADY53851.1 hypothetical protein Pedsa_3316 [Pseudopedobacter saltans DSM 12145]
MKNALKYGLLLALLSGLWILVMHLLGFTPDYYKNSWIELTSIPIPFIGLYFGIRAFRHEHGHLISFFECLVEGFKILVIGAVISGAISFLYLTKFSELNTTDYMQRIFGGLIIGIIANLASSLLLMTTPKHL